MIDALKRFHQKLRSLWAGKKTNIVTVLQGAALIGATVGLQLDPDAIVQWIESLGAWVQTGIALLTAAGVYFRQLGRQREKQAEKALESQATGDIPRAHSPPDG